MAPEHGLSVARELQVEPERRDGSSSEEVPSGDYLPGGVELGVENGMSGSGRCCAVADAEAERAVADADGVVQYADAAIVAAYAYGLNCSQMTRPVL
jgi:hypothetical protein